MDIPAIQNQLESFARERDWNQYYSPKNLTMALSVEASELVEHFPAKGVGDLPPVSCQT